MAAGIALVAADLIAVFHYPVAFMHSIPLIRILASQIPVLGFDMVMAAAIIANGRQKQWVVVGCLAAVLNPSLNLIAIPVTTHLFGNGAIGASIITVATEAFMLCGAFILRPQGVLDRATVGYLIRCILSCLPMFPAVVAVGESGLPVAASLLAKIVAGAAVYGLASLSLRTISSQQILRAGVRLLQSSPLRSLAGAE
jgi:O-antigen/teichoic acid export membrane protein